MFGMYGTVYRQRLRHVLPLALLLLASVTANPRLASAGGVTPFCGGDCSGGGIVSGADVALCTDISLGNRPVSDCPNCDCNRDGAVNSGEIAKALANATNGCTVDCPPVVGNATATPSPTVVVATPSPTIVVATPSPSSTPLPSATTTAPACLGDCDGDHDVTVDDLLKMVTIALSTADLSTCPNADPDHTGEVTVTQIIQAVNNALVECA